MSTPRTVRTIALCLLAPVAAALAGCNSALVGTWKTDSAEAPKGFAIQSVTFKDDNTYEAAARQGDQSTRLAGTYDFNGFELKLKSPGKPERKYGATVYMGRTLEIKADDQKQTLKKQ